MSKTYTKADLLTAVEKTTDIYKKEFGHLVWSNTHMAIINVVVFAFGVYAGYLFGR